MSRQMLLGCFEGDSSPQRSPWQQLERQQEKRRSLLRPSTDIQRPLPNPQEFSRVTGYHNAFAEEPEQEQEQEQDDSTLLPRPDSPHTHPLSSPTTHSSAVQESIPHPHEGRERLPDYSCTITAECPLDMKLERTSPFDAVLEPQWVRVYVVLRGTLLRIHTLKPAGLLAKAPRSLSAADGAGRLLRTYTMQYAEVGLASDHPKVEMIPRSPITQLLPATTLARLRETEPHLFELTRQYVIRIRVETEQILLRFKTSEERHNWIHYLCAAVDIAPPLDDRTEPRFHTIPRRRRPRPTVGIDENNAPDAAAIAEQENILRTHYPNLAGGDRNAQDRAVTPEAATPDSRPTTPEPPVSLLNRPPLEATSAPRAANGFGHGRASQDSQRPQAVLGLAASRTPLRQRSNSAAAQLSAGPSLLSPRRPLSLVSNGSAPVRLLDFVSNTAPNGHGSVTRLGSERRTSQDQASPATPRPESRASGTFGSDARVSAAPLQTAVAEPEEDQKWNSNIRLDPVLEARFRRRCLPALLFHSRRASDFIVSNGQRCKIDWEEQTLKPAAAFPPAYGQDELLSDQFGLTPMVSNLNTAQNSARPSLDGGRPRAFTASSSAARSSIDMMRRRLGRAVTASELTTAAPSAQASARNSLDMSQVRPSGYRTASHTSHSSMDMIRRLGRSNTNTATHSPPGIPITEPAAVPTTASATPHSGIDDSVVDVAERPVRPSGYRTASGATRSSMDFVRRLRRTPSNTSTASNNLQRSPTSSGRSIAKYSCIGFSSSGEASIDAPRPVQEMSQIRPQAYTTISQVSTAQTSRRPSMDVVRRRLGRSITTTTVDTNATNNTTETLTPPTVSTSAFTTARTSMDHTQPELAQVGRVTSSSTVYTSPRPASSIFSTDNSVVGAGGSPTTTYTSSAHSRDRVARPPPSAWKTWVPRLRKVPGGADQDMSSSDLGHGDTHDGGNMQAAAAANSDGDDADADEADFPRNTAVPNDHVVGSRPNRAGAALLRARPLSWLKGRASTDIDRDAPADAAADVPGTRTSLFKSKSAAMAPAEDNGDVDIDADDDGITRAARPASDAQPQARPSRPLSWLVRAASGQSLAGSASHASQAGGARSAKSRAKSGGGCTGFGF